MNPSLLKIDLALGFGALAIGLLGGLLAYLCLQKLPRLKTLPSLPLQFRLQKKMTSSQMFLAGGLILSLVVMAWVDFSTGLLLAFLAVGIWYGVGKGPGLKKNFETKRRQDKMAEVFPQTLGMAVQALKTGQTVPQVLEYLSRECPPPLKEELGQVCREMDLGNSAELALSNMAERFPNFSEFHQFLESYKISRQTGANLTHLLEVLLEGMEEKNRLLRKMQAMTAQARLSGLMMGLLPFLLAFVFFLMDPELMTPLFTEKIGWAILLLAAILETIGFLWIRQLLQLEV